MARKVNQSNIITRELEIELAERIREGRTAAVWQLAEYATPLIWREVGKYREYRVDREDLFAEGRFGAMKAAQAFDPTRGTFFAFAKLYVREMIATYVRKNAYAVEVEADVFKQRPGKEHLTHLSRQWSYAESLQDPAGSDDTGSLICLSELEPDLKGADFPLESRLMVRAAVEKLTPQQRRLIGMTYLDGDMTGDEVATALGISKAGVSKLKTRAFAELAKLLAAM